MALSDADVQRQVKQITLIVLSKTKNILIKFC